jgi:Cu(I)/Ag(I) efflux system protein CusF
VCALFFGATAPISGLAQQSQVPIEDHPGHVPEPYDPASAEPARGEVVVIDGESGRITLRHGATAALAMPAMTMEFRVGDARTLRDLRSGDQVSFEADVFAGVPTIIRMQRLPRPRRRRTWRALLPARLDPSSGKSPGRASTAAAAWWRGTSRRAASRRFKVTD